MFNPKEYIKSKLGRRLTDSTIKSMKDKKSVFGSIVKPGDKIACILVATGDLYEPKSNKEITINISKVFEREIEKFLKHYKLERPVDTYSEDYDVGAVCFVPKK